MQLIYFIQDNRFFVQLLAFVVPFVIFYFYIPYEKNFPHLLLGVVIAYYAIFFSVLIYTDNLADFLGSIIGAALFFCTLSFLLWNIYRQSGKSFKNNFDKMFTIMLEQHNNFFLQKDFNEKIINIYDDLAFVHVNKERRKSEFSVLNRYTDNYNAKSLEAVFSETEHNEINAYLRFLYNFLKYLSDHRNDIEYTTDYSDILRSFIPPNLLHVIAMNGLRESYYPDEFDSYRNLLERFHFLEHLDLNVFHQNITKIQELENYSFHENNIIKIETKLAGEISDYERTKLLQHLVKQRESIDKCKEIISEFSYDKDFHFFIYSKYRCAAYGQNPFYVTYILPALTFLVEEGKLPSDILDAE